MTKYTPILSYRQLEIPDLDEVMRIENNAFPEVDMQELPESVAAKIKGYPAGTAGAFAGEIMLGYCIGHPWLSGNPVPLGMTELTLPHDANIWYMHDVCVIDTSRGQGIGEELLKLQKARAIVDGFSMIEAVSVQGAETYWVQQGFTEQGPGHESYGPGAVKITMPIK